MGTTNSSNPLSSSTSSPSSGLHHYQEKSESSFNRRAYHSGSWYSSSPSELDATLTSFLSDARSENNGSEHKTQNGDYPVTTTTTSSGGVPRAIIAPHAGYSYSGPTAAYAYLALDEAIQNGTVSQIVVLHPSHHLRLDGCAVSGANALETPLGNLPICTTLRTELLQTKHFTIMSRHDDENEHSGEMQYPFLAKLSSSTTKRLSVLPIMIGGLTPQQETQFGKLLAPILHRDTVFTVISSDFCHWGRRFNYMPHDPTMALEVFEYIRYLDEMGMDCISSMEPQRFATYLREYRNTICGRHPIGVWLNALKEGEEDGCGMVVEFVKYAQSGKVRGREDSSVSYASAVARKRVELRN